MGKEKNVQPAAETEKKKEQISILEKIRRRTGLLVGIVGLALIIFIFAPSTLCGMLRFSSWFKFPRYFYYLSYNIGKIQIKRYTLTNDNPIKEEKGTACIAVGAAAGCCQPALVDGTHGKWLKFSPV